MSETPRRLVVVGLSHHRAPLEVRERLALDAEEEQRLHEALGRHDAVREWVVLNTCNRIEIYLHVVREVEPLEVVSLLARVKGLAAGDMEPWIYAHYNSRMATHLFAVCSGIDSQMVGETEILGQVKQAFQAARERGSVKGDLHRIFERSFQAAKWARRHTAIGSGQVSIGNVAVELAERIFGDLVDCRMLVVGSGEVAERVLHCLCVRGCKDITIAARNEEQASRLAHQYRGSQTDFAHFGERFDRYDIVLFSTAAKGAIITADTVRRAQRRRGYLPLFMIDLAMPRDVDPSAGDIDDVFLYNLDDLSAIANRNLESRRSEVARCEVELSRRAWQAWLRFYRVRGWRVE